MAGVILAPWLQHDPVAAAARGAQLLLERRQQDIAQSEFGARMAAEAERTAAARALQVAQMQMLHTYRQSEEEHRHALEAAASRRLDLTEAGQEQRGSAADALLKARYELEQKQQDSIDERTNLRLENQNEQHQKALKAERQNREISNAQAMKRLAYSKLLSAQGNHNKEDEKTFQAEVDHWDDEIRRLEVAQQTGGDESGGAAADLSRTAPPTIPSVLSQPEQKFNFGALPNPDEQSGMFGGLPGTTTANASPSAPAVGKKIKVLSISPADDTGS